MAPAWRIAGEGNANIVLVYSGSNEALVSPLIDPHALIGHAVFYRQSVFPTVKSLVKSRAFESLS